LGGLLLSFLVGIAVGVGLTILDLEAFGFGLGGAVALLHLLVAPGVGLGLLGFGIKSRRPKLRRIGLALVLAAVASFLASGMLLSRKISDSKAAGDALCLALEECRQISGRYPQDLQALAPSLLPAVPTTSMGLFSSVPFDYRPSPSGEDFILGFDSTFFMYCARSRSATWRCDD
jgi:hypothetical protein